MLNLATRVAEQSALKHRHGAVVYKSGRVLSTGINVGRNSHPTMELPLIEYTIHAEISAIRSVAIELLRGSTLYVARVNSKGNSINSEPCLYCKDTLKEFGIKRIVHT